MTFISIVTVCLNSAGTIADTLRSVNEQTHLELEHIVIDGGSRDATPALVHMHGMRVSRFVSEPDRGIYDAMNKGLALASGDVVGFLNADDAFASPQAAAEIARAFDRGIDACYGDVVFVDALQGVRTMRHWRGGVYERGAFTRGWAPPHPTLYVRRDRLLQLGGFDDRMRIAADFDLALRLLEGVQAPVAYLPQVLVRMRAGGASNGSVRSVLQGHREMHAALRAQGLTAGWGWSLRRLARRIPQLLFRP